MKFISLMQFMEFVIFHIFLSSAAGFYFWSSACVLHFFVFELIKQAVRCSDLDLCNIILHSNSLSAHHCGFGLV